MKRGGFLTSADREALDRFPAEVDADDLDRCFALTSSDRSEIVARRYGPAARLAGGLQLGALRLLGFVPSDLSTAPGHVVRQVAALVSAAPEDLDRYTTRTKSRFEHVDAVERHLGFRRMDRGDLKALGDWLVERALEHDRPIVLFRLGCEHLRANGLVRPGVTTIERAVVAARQRATEETYLRIASQIDGRRTDLDALLVVEPALAMTPLVWLRQQGPAPVPATIKEQLAKIERLRAVGADQINLDALNPNRVRHLAAVGGRLTPQAIARLEPARRYQILAATVVEGLTERIDEVLDLFGPHGTQDKSPGQRRCR